MPEPYSFPVGSETLTGRIARPAGDGPSPGVLLLPAIAGVNDYIDRTAVRLAEAGYVTLVLDYYSREGAAPDTSTPEKIGAAVAGLDDRRVLSDIGGALAALSADPSVGAGPVATLGFCIGGIYAYLAACDHDGVTAAVDYYGLIAYGQTSEKKPVSPIDRAAELKAPLLAHFGDFDRLISMNDIDAFGAALRTHQKHHEICVYRGGVHAFDEEFRPEVFRPVAAGEAWRRSLAFLDWHLRGIAPR